MRGAQECPAAEPNQQKITFVALNVQSLSKRLETILSLGKDILLLSEVRVSRAQQASLARRAASLGYQVIWSPPPKASATFALAPGGTAICVRFGVGVSAITPPQLDRWHAMGRVCAAKIVMGSEMVFVVVTYGFAPNHQDRSLNEAMLMQTGLWIAELNAPVLWAGDLNVTVPASPFLALLCTIDLWRIFPDESSTRGKHASSSGKVPIDHVIFNSKCLDLCVSCVFDSIAPLSDHHPCIGSFHVCVQKGMLPSWRWPKPMTIAETDPDTPWSFQGSSYTEWAEHAAEWLALASGASKVSKVSISSSFPSTPVLRPPPEYMRLRRMRSYLARLEKRFIPNLWDKLCTALVNSQSHAPTDIEEALECVMLWPLDTLTSCRRMLWQLGKLK